jgi:formylglycine-generating enzyme required for sulfatase activity
MGIASTAPEQLTDEKKQAWQPILADWYRHAPDKELHSAAGWALRHWHMKLPVVAASAQPQDGRDWHVNSIGMTMLHIPAGSFVRKTPYLNPNEKMTTPQIDQKVQLTRPSLIADRELSLREFREFLNDSKCPADEKPQNWERADPSYDLGPEHPAYTVSWYDAVLFCNWLSRKEGLQRCYERTGKKEKSALTPMTSGASLRRPTAIGCRSRPNPSTPAGPAP